MFEESSGISKADFLILLSAARLKLREDAICYCNNPDWVVKVGLKYDRCFNCVLAEKIDELCKRFNLRFFTSPILKPYEWPTAEFFK